MKGICADLREPGVLAIGRSHPIGLIGQDRREVNELNIVTFFHCLEAAQP